jgi:beta-lactamase class A
MIIGLSGVLACVIAHQEPSPEMDRRVRAIVGEVRGKTFLFARNLKTGSSYGIHADLPVRTASTIKLPVFVALHEEVRVGRLKWDEKLVLHEKSKESFTNWGRACRSRCVMQRG